MKFKPALALITLAISCKSFLVTNTANITGDYTQGHCGWQLRLYSDSQFYLNYENCIEGTLGCAGHWSQKNPHELTLTISCDTISSALERLESIGYYIEHHWSLELINDNEVQLKEDGKVIRPNLIHGALNITKDNLVHFGLDEDLH